MESRHVGIEVKTDKIKHFEGTKLKRRGAFKKKENLRRLRPTEPHSDKAGNKADKIRPSTTIECTNITYGITQETGSHFEANFDIRLLEWKETQSEIRVEKEKMSEVNHVDVYSNNNKSRSTCAHNRLMKVGDPGASSKTIQTKTPMKENGFQHYEVVSRPRQQQRSNKDSKTLPRAASDSNDSIDRKLTKPKRHTYKQTDLEITNFNEINILNFLRGVQFEKDMQMFLSRPCFQGKASETTGPSLIIRPFKRGYNDVFKFINDCVTKDTNLSNAQTVTDVISTNRVLETCEVNDATIPKIEISLNNTLCVPCSSIMQDKSEVLDVFSDDFLGDSDSESFASVRGRHSSTFTFSETDSVFSLSVYSPSGTLSYLSSDSDTESFVSVRGSNGSHRCFSDSSDTSSMFPSYEPFQTYRHHSTNTCRCEIHSSNSSFNVSQPRRPSTHKRSSRYGSCTRYFQKPFSVNESSIQDYSEENDDSVFCDVIYQEKHTQVYSHERTATYRVGPVCLGTATRGSKPRCPRNPASLERVTAILLSTDKRIKRQNICNYCEDSLFEIVI